MSLRSQAAIDWQATINSDGDPATLTKPDSTEITVNAQVTRVDMETDPDTGVMFYNPKTAVTASLKEIGEEPQTGWEISTVDVLGNVVSGVIADVRYNRTLGFVTMILEDA